MLIILGLVALAFVGFVTLTIFSMVVGYLILKWMVIFSFLAGCLLGYMIFGTGAGALCSGVGALVVAFLALFVAAERNQKQRETQRLAKAAVDAEVHRKLEQEIARKKRSSRAMNSDPVVKWMKALLK